MTTALINERSNWSGVFGGTSDKISSKTECVMSTGEDSQECIELSDEDENGEDSGFYGETTEAELKVVEGSETVTYGSFAMFNGTESTVSTDEDENFVIHWDIDEDGDYEDYTAMGRILTAQDLGLIFNSTGEHTVRFTVEDANGNTDSDTATVTVVRDASATEQWTEDLIPTAEIKRTDEDDPENPEERDGKEEPHDNDNDGNEEFHVRLLENGNKMTDYDEKPCSRDKLRDTNCVNFDPRERYEGENGGWLWNTTRDEPGWDKKEDDAWIHLWLEPGEHEITVARNWTADNGWTLETATKQISVGWDAG